MKWAEGASSFQHSEMRDGGIGRTEDGLRSEARSRGETAQNSLWLRDCISLDVERGVVTEVSLIFPDVSMRPPGSDTRQQRSDGKIQRSIRRSEDRDAASSVFRGSAEGKAERECHRFARPPQLALPTEQYPPKTSPLFTLPLRWKEQAGTPRSGRGGPSGAMSSIVPAATGRRPRGCEKLPCTCRACHFQQRYRPRPTVSGLNFLAVKLFPLLPLVTAQRSGNLRLRRHRDHLPTMLGACQCAHVPRTQRVP